MSEHDLSEIALQEGEQRIRLRKGATTAPAFLTAPAPVAPAVSHAAPAAPAAPHTAAPTQPAAPAKHLIEIKSPMVGTFYSRPDPKKPEFVTVGSKVTPRTVVCTIEAMKLYNEVHAECAGTIAEVCVKSGDPVEFETVLFRVDPS
ncbi:MAG: acetyl-CoA carboxylase biotin carboxyl carrier protein [Planctomycetes bacterium]|nr:acetyl-CoA carboxylase biotin carboxyl carrier protein [Planctomycetota bacterium]